MLSSERIGARTRRLIVKIRHMLRAVRLTEMQEDLPVVPLHVQLVFTEEFLVLLLSDLRHDVLSFL